MNVSRPFFLPSQPGFEAVHSPQTPPQRGSIQKIRWQKTHHYYHELQSKRVAHVKKIIQSSGIQLAGQHKLGRRQHMQKRLNTLALTVGVSLAAALSANAQSVYEGFNYTAGTGIEGLSGGSGWTAAWATGANVNLATNFSSSLTYGSLLTSGGSLVLGDINQPALAQARPNRNLPSTFGTLGAANGGFIWMSFLYQDLQSTTGSPFLRQANMALFQGSSEYWDLGLDNTSATVNNNASVWDGGHGIGTWTGAAPLQSTVPITQGNTMLFVVEFIVDNTVGTADTANVWIDPTLGGSLGTPSLSDTTQDLTGISNIRFQANNSNANGLNATFQVDEIRIGNSPLDVMPLAAPEPAIWGLMAVGGLALAALRRKRQ